MNSGTTFAWLHNICTHIKLISYTAIHDLQLIIVCGGGPMLALGNLLIHMFVSFLVANSKAYDSMLPN
jgi:hypothetical protein